MRLNKYLASCGLGSRRQVESLVAARRVKINGEVVEEFGRAVEDGDQVTVDDQLLTPEPLTYLALHKPRGYICAVTDEHYPVALDLLPERYDRLRLFPVGRLDLQSEGLILLTNDGDFAQQLIHPSKGMIKEYEVRMNRALTDADLGRLARGVTVAGRRLVPLSVKALPKRRPEGWWATFRLREGIKREIRLMAEANGLGVEVLFRRAIGGLRLERLPVGAAVEMSKDRLWDLILNGGTI